MIKRMQSENQSKRQEKGYLLTDIGLKLVSELHRKQLFDWGFSGSTILDYTSDQIKGGNEVLEHTRLWLFCGKD